MKPIFRRNLYNLILNFVLFVHITSSWVIVYTLRLGRGIKSQAGRIREIKVGIEHREDNKDVNREI